MNNFKGLTAVFFLVLHGWMSWGEASEASGERRIADCPRSPNCVSSVSSSGARRIAPLTFKGSPDEAFQCLERIVRGMKRTTIVVVEKSYLHAEFRTFVGFVDDVEFLVNSADRTVLMRSASRAGYWDLGVNRRRLEAVRRAFDSQCR